MSIKVYEVINNRIMELTAIHTDPGKADALCSRITNHVENQLAFGSKLNIVRHTRFFAAFSGVSPLLGEV